MASGALANLAAQGIPFVLLLIVTPILLRWLGRERYGALVLFNLLPQIASQLDLGLSTAAIRGFAHHCARRDHRGAMRLFREAALLLTGWGILLGAAFYLFHPAIARQLKLGEAVDADSFVYLAAAASIPLAMVNSAALVPLRALERYATAAQVQVVAGVAYWTVATLWVERGGGLPQLVTFGTACVAATTVVLYLIARATSPQADRRGSGSAAPDPSRPVPGARPALLLRPFLTVGASAFVAQASSLATFNADKLLISALLSPAAAGAYTICTSLANKTLMVIASLATFTFPRATQLHASGDVQGLRTIYRSAARICAALAMTALVPILGFAHLFLSLWLGPAFADDHALVLRLLAIGYALAASSVVAANVTMGIGSGRIAAAFALLGGALTIGSLMVLTPGFGIVGAACASLIGMSQTVVFNVIVSRRLGPEATRTSWPLLLQLALVGAPIAVGLAWLAPSLDHWSAFIPASAIAVALFPLAWLSSFGRDEEWPMMKAMMTPVRG